MTDPRLPQLETALDPSAMAGVLERECLRPAGEYDVNACRIEYVRYKPGRTCLVCYDLGVRDRQGREFHHKLCGRIYEPQTSRERWRKAAAQALTPVRIGDPVMHIADMDMVLWAFPNDRKLRGLDVLLDPVRLARAVLPPLLPGEQILEATPELVRYVPEDRCTVRVTVRTRHGCRALYAKAYAGDAGAQTYEWMRALWERRAPDLIVPRPLGYGGRTLWQEELAGEPIDLSTAPTPCARAIAALHRQDLGPLPHRDSSELLRRLDAARSQACAAGFASPALESVCQELRDRAASLEPLPAATLHGDLTLKNLLLACDAAALIDLDALRRGNPLEDVGCLLASVYYRAALENRAPAEAEQTAAAFVRAYRDSVPWPVPARDVAWHAAHALVCERVCCSIKQQKGDAGRVVQVLLAAAQSLLSATETARDVVRRFENRLRSTPGEILDVHFRMYRSRRSWRKAHLTVVHRTDAPEPELHVERSGATCASWRFPNDPVMTWLPRAVTPELVRECLPFQAENVTVEVLRYKPEERCTLRYRALACGREIAVYGKTHVGGEGRSADETLRILWRLSGGGGPAFPMPRPLGYSEEIRMVWQEEFPGLPLADCLLREDARELLAGAAARLAFLHAAPIPCPPRVTLEQRLEDLDKKLAKLAVVLPEYGARLLSLTRDLRERMPHLAPVPPAVVHGDFHLRQFVVRGGDVGLFDFDDLGQGDPVEDFGHFIADLQDHGFEATAAARIVSTVLAAYERAAGWAIPRDRLAWHTVLETLARAYRGLLQLKPGLEEEAARLIRYAETYA